MPAESPVELGDIDAKQLHLTAAPFREYAASLQAKGDPNADAYVKLATNYDVWTVTEPMSMHRDELKIPGIHVVILGAPESNGDNVLMVSSASSTGVQLEKATFSGKSGLSEQINVIPVDTHPEEFSGYRGFVGTPQAAGESGQYTILVFRPKNEMHQTPTEMAADLMQHYVALRGDSNFQIQLSGKAVNAASTGPYSQRAQRDTTMQGSSADQSANRHWPGPAVWQAVTNIFRK